MEKAQQKLDFFDSLNAIHLSFTLEYDILLKKKKKLFPFLFFLRV